MSRRSLIIYSSWGGNTEKVAITYKKVFEKKGWQCDMLKVTAKTDVRHPGVCLDDYDFLCVGSLVIGGLPTKEIFDDHLGLLMPASLIPGRRPRFGEFDPINKDYTYKKGIIFVTYTGGRRGPSEAHAALAMLELRLEDMRIKVIGKFACPGGHRKGSSSGSSDVIQGLTEKEATSTIAEYFGDTHEEPEPISAEGMSETSGSRDWHWNVESRPSARDLLKAEIFLEEILEDYYEGGIEAAPLAQYICIA